MNEQSKHRGRVRGAAGWAMVALFFLAGGAAARATCANQSGDSSGLGADVLLSTFREDDLCAAVAYNSDDGEFLAVWSHQGHIYGQRYDGQGVPQGQNFPISLASNGKYRPAAAYCPSTHSYLVVWEDYRNSAEADIYGQRVGADGTLLDNPDPTVNFPIYTGAGDQVYADLDCDGSDCLVVWQGNQSSFYQVFGRFVACDGTVDSTVYGLSGTGSVDRQEPAVAYNASEDEYLVVFAYGEEDGAEIHGRRIEAGGIVPSSEYTIADQSDAEDPDVAAADGSTYVVVWSDRRTGHAFIYGQVVQAGADALVDGDLEICAVVYNHYEPAIARSSTGQFLVVWQDGRQSSDTGWNVYGQLLLADASLDGTNFPVCGAGDDQRLPAVAAGPSPGIYLVAWEDERNGESYDIYGQRVAWTGSPLWYEFAISAEPDQQMSYPAVAYNGDDGQYLAVWSDFCTGEIYGQRLSFEGQPLEEPWVIATAAADTFAMPDVTYSSQRNHYAVIWYDADGASRIAGRLVYPAGQSTVSFALPDGADSQAPSIAYDSADDYFLVAWRAGGDIYAQVLGGEGICLGDRIEVATGADEQNEPAVVFDPDHDRFLVVWWIDRPSSTDDDIEGRLVLPDGTTPDPAFCIAGCGDNTHRETPAVTYNPDGDEYMVVYEYVQAPSDLDLYGQRVTWDGIASESEVAVWTEVALIHQADPDIVYVPGLNRYYVIWSDARNMAENGYDLYGRWLGADGIPISFSLPAFRYPGSQHWPDLAYDADRQQALVVWNDARRSYDGTYARLGVLDTTPPVAGFLRIPSSGLAGTTFTLNAWPSSDDLTPRGALMVRWDRDDDGSFDTPWSLDKVLTQTIGTPGVHTVTLEVRDLMWFTDSVSLPITVLSASANTPPTATLVVTPLSGAAGANFQFDASASTDAETPGTLQARWDWDGDGVADTVFGSSLTASHVYTVAGFCTVFVEVLDEGGLTDAAAGIFVVTSGPVADLEVLPSAATLSPLETIRFRAWGWDSYDNRMSNPDVTWSVLDGTAGAINANGLFTASLQAGTYPGSIQGTNNGTSDTASVSIVYPYQVYLPLVFRSL